MPDEPMDVPAVIEKLERALALQHRSALQYTLTSGSLFGLEYQGLGDRLWLFAEAELADARLLVEKVPRSEARPPPMWPSCAGAAIPPRR